MALSTVSPLTQQVANAIAEACVACRKPPQHMLWRDLKRFLKEEKQLEADELRQVEAHISSVGGFVNLRNAFFISTSTPHGVEAAEVRALAKLGKASTNILVKDELFLQRFEELTTKAVAGLRDMKVYRPGRRPAGREKTRRIVTLDISDTHFGSKLDPRELPYRYDFEEEARALASVMVRLVEFKPDHRAETELVVWLGGDLTRGKIHDKQAGRPGAEQGADAMYLLLQAIIIAAANFKRVSVYCSSGNHDRDESRHPGTPHDEIWDSRATLVYFGIKLAVAHLPNVEVFVPRTPYCEWETFGFRVYSTHGHVGFRPGNPGNSINIASLDKQMTKINMAEVTRGLKPYSVFQTGHVHQGIHLPLPVGELIVNPALIPVDGFARDIGYSLTRPGQTLYEATESRPVGDLRWLWVEPEVLKDSSLDKVIKPFKDF